MSFHLRNFIGAKAYEAQKEIGKKILDSLTKKGKKIVEETADEVYVVQKKVLADAQKKIEEKVKEQYVITTNKTIDLVIERLAKTGFFGKIASSILKANKKAILNSLGIK